MRYGYVGPAPTIIEAQRDEDGNEVAPGRHIAPGTSLDEAELSERERAFLDGEGWLVPIEDPAELTGDQLKARAAELEIDGRSNMTADELRAAVADAEAATAGNGD